MRSDHIVARARRGHQRREGTARRRALAALLLACASSLAANGAESVQYAFESITVPAASADEPRRAGTAAVGAAVVVGGSLATRLLPPSAQTGRLHGWGPAGPHPKGVLAVLPGRPKSPETKDFLPLDRGPAEPRGPGARPPRRRGPPACLVPRNPLRNISRSIRPPAPRCRCPGARPRGAVLRPARLRPLDLPRAPSQTGWFCGTMLGFAFAAARLSCQAS